MLFGRSGAAYFEFFKVVWFGRSLAVGARRSQTVRSGNYRTFRVVRGPWASRQRGLCFVLLVATLVSTVACAGENPPEREGAPARRSLSVSGPAPSVPSTPSEAAEWPSRLPPPTESDEGAAASTGDPVPGVSGDPGKRGSAGTPPRRPEQAALRIPIGISYGDRLAAMDAGLLARTLDDARSIGITSLRVQFGWDRAQPTGPDSYEWAAFDRLAAAARSRGLQLLPVLTFTPAWARADGCDSPRCRPLDVRAFARFAGAAAGRYAQLDVHTWEIWNEPNSRGAWLPRADSSEYVEILRAASRSIRAADPSARIVSGGLASKESKDGNISQLDFLEAMCASGVNRDLDAVGFHPYSYPVLPSTSIEWNAWSQIVETPRSFASILRAHGSPDMPIWLTEYGAPTGGPGATATASDTQVENSPDHVDEQYQAMMATDSVEAAVRTEQIGGLFWYTDRDLGVDRGNVENFFGLRRVDGSVKPAWDALRTAIRAATARAADSRD